MNPDSWLWCLHCERFFQAKDLREDAIGGRQGCAFEGCNGAGLGVDIYGWNDWAKQNPMKHWPKSTADLEKGMRTPLYPTKSEAEKRSRDKSLAVKVSRDKKTVPNAVGLQLSEDTLTVQLSDQRTISVPLSWYPRLLHGSVKERADWRLVARGQGIHWESLDEDISVEGLLAGRHSGESQTSFKRWLEAREKRK